MSLVSTSYEAHGRSQQKQRTPVHRHPGGMEERHGSHPGVNSNVLTDERPTDPLSGNAVVNAIPVTVARVS